MYFAKFLNAFVKPRNLNFSRNKSYIWNLRITRFKMIYDIFVFQESEIFRTSKNGLKSDYFAKIAHKITKSKYFFRYLKRFGLLDKFPFRRCIICWGNLIENYWWGAPRTAASFYSAKLCSSLVIPGSSLYQGFVVQRLNCM